MDSRTGGRIRRACGLWRLAKGRLDHATRHEILSLIEDAAAAPALAGYPGLVEATGRVTRLLRAEAAGDSPMPGHVIEELDDLFDLLARSVQRRADRSAKTVVDQARLFGRMVYVAVDDDAYANLLCPQLELFQYQAVRVSSEDDVVARGAAEGPSAIIIDADFGGRLDGGLTACHRLSEALGDSVPALVLCATDDFRTRLNVVRIGGHRMYTGRPDPVSLIEEIRRILQRDEVAPIRVLACDDSLTNLYHIETDLSSAGMEVKAVSTPATLMDSIDDFRPEIVLLDLYMPEASGVEMAKMIRMQEQHLSMPIVFISQETDIDLQVKVMASGDEFVEKPYTPNRLIQAVRNRVLRSREISRLLTTDSMTGVLNHKHSFMALERAVEDARRHGREFAWVMLDLDHFKSINDTHGHDVGDVVIKGLALLLKQRLRAQDVIGRYGGEEFVALLPDTGPADAFRVVDDLRERFSAIRHAHPGGTLQVTMSAGISVGRGGEGAAELAKTADEALYEAKRAGRNRVVVAPFLDLEGTLAG